MGFILGIEKGPFPLRISLRYEDNEFIVFDDLLGLSPLHLNVIPTAHYIPDWRYLLRRPSQGLQLIRSMLEKCHDVAKGQFLCNRQWVRALVRADAPAELSPEEHFGFGFNYPPSQAQLHVQYIAPMMLPFQMAQLLRGVHFTCERFFPFRYVERCLQVAIAQYESFGVGLPHDLLQPDTPVAKIIDYFTHHGVDYSKARALFLHERIKCGEWFCNWSPEDFEGVAADLPGLNGSRRTVFLEHGGSAVNFDVDVAAANAADRLELQNYGRPYGANGEPTGRFYQFPRRWDELDEW
jgi:hypothetical protein